MKQPCLLTIILFFLVICISLPAQKIDTLEKPTHFSGIVGLTNNSFSIVPTFSLNSPGVNMFMSWRKEKWSFDPDFRFNTKFTKGSMIFWLRYRAIESKKFNCRIGVHPAINYSIRSVAENVDTFSIIQARRFIAFELSPNYFITPRWSIGMYYLQGQALQSDGPRKTNFITFNTNISNIILPGKIKFQFSPSFYLLFLDGKSGHYMTGTGTLSKDGIPLLLQYTFNKTFKTNISGSIDYVWSMSLSYFFNKRHIALNK